MLRRVCLAPSWSKETRIQVSGTERTVLKRKGHEEARSDRRDESR